MLRTLSGCVAIILAALAAGCASTKFVNTWTDPGYSGAPLTKILVIAVSKQAGIRRSIEDEFVRQLQAQGVQAVPSYKLIPEDGEVPKERLAQAVQEAGADGVLITRLVKVERETKVYPGSFGPPYWGMYGFYSSAWMGFYDPPQIVTYEVATSEANLFHAQDEKLIWSGTTETFSPRDMDKYIKEFAVEIVKALKQRKLI
jgi:hypothetical protein